MLGNKTDSNYIHRSQPAKESARLLSRPLSKNDTNKARTNGFSRNSDSKSHIPAYVCTLISFNKQEYWWNTPRLIIYDSSESLDQCISRMVLMIRYDSDQDSFRFRQRSWLSSCCSFFKKWSELNSSRAGMRVSPFSLTLGLVRSRLSLSQGQRWLGGALEAHWFLV